MTNHPDERSRRDSRAPERLPEPVASKLLERASEIDARLRAGSTVDELREAAKSAGISAEAFEAALAEVAPETKKVPVMVFERTDAPEVRANYVRFARAMALLPPLIFAISMIFLTVSRWSARQQRASAPTAAVAPTYQSYELRLTCLSGEEAATIVRAIVMQRGPAASGFRMGMTSREPGVLRVSASGELLREIQVAIKKADNDPTRTCTLKQDAKWLSPQR